MSVSRMRWVFISHCCQTNITKSLCHPHSPLQGMLLPEESGKQDGKHGSASTGSPWPDLGCSHSKDPQELKSLLPKLSGGITLYFNSYKLMFLLSPVIGWFLSHISHHGVSAWKDPWMRPELFILQVEIDRGHNWVFLDKKSIVSRGPPMLPPSQ